MRGKYTPLPVHVPKSQELRSNETPIHQFIHSKRKTTLFICFCFILLFISLAQIRLDGDKEADIVIPIVADGFWDQGELKGWRTFDLNEENNNIEVENNNEKKKKKKLSSLPHLKATEAWSSECLDQWVNDGRLCESMRNDRAFKKEITKVDVLQTWVDGNEPLNLLANWRKLIFKALGGGAGVKGNTRWGDTSRNRKHFRTHDELKYSLRSIVASFSSSLRRIHLITTDLPFGITPSSSSTYEESLSSLPPGIKPSMRVGQIPKWLNTTIIGKSTTPLNLIHHSQFFEDNLDGVKKNSLNGSLPSFSSLAIESQFCNLKDDVTDHALYMNDDIFLFGKFSASDIGSPLTGPVFRIQNDLKVDGLMGINTGDREGEWPSLRYSNYLLDKRFGYRKRHYLTHVGKTISLPLLLEASQIWSEEFSETAQSRFRGRPEVQELQMAFLQTHYIIERHREALLWSFFVARSDSNQDGTLSLSERKKMVKELGYSSYSSSEDLQGYLPVRNSLEDLKKSFEVTGLEEPLATRFAFSSMDGYVGGFTYGRGKWPLASSQIETVKEDLIAQEEMKVNKPTKKQVKLQQLQQAKKLRKAKAAKQMEQYAPQKPLPLNHQNLSPVCQFNGRVCFGEDFLSSSKSFSTNKIFKRVAFEKYWCGDCAILLILAAEENGLANFLPDKLPIDTSTTAKEEPPVEALGFEKDYHLIEFAPFKPSSTFTVRQRAIRLIHRYSYIIGESSTSFISMRGPLSLISVLAPLDLNFALKTGEPIPVKEPPTFLTLNDDVVPGSVDMKKLSHVLHMFFNSVWSVKAPWEI